MARQRDKAKRRQFNLGTILLITTVVCSVSASARGFGGGFLAFGIFYSVFTAWVVLCDENKVGQATATLSRPRWPWRILVALAWLPLIGLIVFYVPMLEVMFSPLQERGELPAVTEWVMWFSALNQRLFFVPILLFLVLLLLADAHVVSLAERSQQLYWMWLTGIVVVSCLAAGIVVLALLLPVIDFSPTM